MSPIPPDPQDALDDHQQGCLTAVDALLAVTLRDYSTAMVVPQEVRTVLVRLARGVCGGPQRADELITAALDDDRPASEVLPRLHRRWAQEDARPKAVFDGRRFGGLTYGGELLLEQETDGTYKLTVTDQHEALGRATVSLRLDAEEMGALSDSYVARRDSQQE